MALEKPDVVDAAGLDTSSGRPVLSLLDSWPWSKEREHLLALQAKLNSYIAFVESDQIWEQYPGARGKRVIIDVISRFEIPEAGLQLLEVAARACAELGIELRRTRHPG
jgi:hypothetical protein